MIEQGVTMPTAMPAVKPTAAPQDRKLTRGTFDLTRVPTSGYPRPSRIGDAITLAITTKQQRTRTVTCFILQPPSFFRTLPTVIETNSERAIGGDLVASMSREMRSAPRTNGDPKGDSSVLPASRYLADAGLRPGPQSRPLLYRHGLGCTASPKRPPLGSTAVLETTCSCKYHGCRPAAHRRAGSTLH